MAELQPGMRVVCTDDGSNWGIKTGDIYTIAAVSDGVLPREMVSLVGVARPDSPLRKYYAHRFTPIEQETDMDLTNLTDRALIDRRRQLAHKADAVEQEIRRREVPPEPTSGLIRFKKAFATGGKSYEYAAIRANGLWWLTGREGAVSRTWKQLCEFIRQDNVLDFSYLEAVSACSITLPRWRSA